MPVIRTFCTPFNAIRGARFALVRLDSSSLTRGENSTVIEFSSRRASVCREKVGKKRTIRATSLFLIYFLRLGKQSYWPT